MNTEIEKIDERRGCTSASNAHADLLCPGRHLAQRGLTRTESKDANTGQRIHAALSIGKADGLTLEEQETFDRCRAIEAKKVQEFFGTTDGLRFWPEQRYWVMFKEVLPGTPAGTPAAQAPVRVLEHSAKPDKIYRLKNRLLIIEYKTLFGDVAESPRNMQLRDQAVVAAGHFIADEVGVVVIQPWVDQNPEICLYTRPDLERAHQELLVRVRASNDIRSQRIPGDIQCKFCLAKQTCVEYQRWAGATVPVMLNLLDVPIASWTPDQRRTFCDRFDVAQKWLNEAWEAMEKGAMENPDFVQGYAMVPGNERVEITDPQGVFQKFVALGGTVDQYLKAVKISKTALAEAVNEATGLKGKKLQEQLTQIVDGHSVKKQNKASLKKVGP